MIKWTTPTLKCTLPSDLVFDYVLLTLKQNKVKIEKRVEYAEVVDGVFYVTFTQEETSRFSISYDVEAQLNVMNGETRLATNIIKMEVGENLYDKLL